MSYVKVTAEGLKKRKSRAKKARIILLILIIIFTLLYIVLGLIYNGGRFTITLDPNFSSKSGIVSLEKICLAGFFE